MTNLIKVINNIKNMLTYLNKHEAVLGTCRDEIANSDMNVELHPQEYQIFFFNVKDKKQGFMCWDESCNGDYRNEKTVHMNLPVKILQQMNDKLYIECLRKAKEQAAFEAARAILAIFKICQH